MKTLWILCHLLWLSWEDMREGQLSLIVIGELGGSGLLCAVLAGQTPQLLPGIALLMVSRLTKESVGAGDGWLLLALGMWFSAQELLFLLFVGVGLAALCGCCFRAKELPLVPFLTAAYMIASGVF